jgi:hypothetical protein
MLAPSVSLHSITVHKTVILPPLWSGGQRSGFDSQHYQISLEVVGLERGPLDLVSTIEEVFGRIVAASV